MNKPYCFLGQTQLEQHYHQHYLPYWQRYGQSYTLLGCGQLKLCYFILKAAHPNHTLLVISPGRSEGYIKYQELAYELCQHGFDCLIIDHRGQGFSARETANHQLGDVSNFDDYCRDFQHIVETVLEQGTYHHQYILAHSMGACIAARYLQQYAHPFHAAVFCAPMFGINTGAIPQPLARHLATLLRRYEQKRKLPPAYAPGQGPYKVKAYENNPLSRCPSRFAHMQRQYQDYPALRLGGPSNRWLNESFKAMNAAIKHAARIDIPLLVLQAQLDTIVDNRGQQHFCQNNSHAQLSMIEHARHEILFEADHIRTPALKQIIRFLTQHDA